jgi:hypothetical protein
VAYQTAVHALELQERAVEQVRSRTGILLAATSLTASFLGAETLRGSSDVGTLEGLALAALVFSIVGCLYITVPKGRFVFSLNGPAMYEALYEFADDPEEVHRRLAYWLEGYWEDNQALIDAQLRFYAASATASGLQLILWCVALTGNLA